jgi:hypothetical protein
MIPAKDHSIGNNVDRIFRDMKREENIFCKYNVVCRRLSAHNIRLEYIQKTSSHYANRTRADETFV